MNPNLMDLCSKVYQNIELLLPSDRYYINKFLTFNNHYIPFPYKPKRQLF